MMASQAPLSGACSRGGAAIWLLVLLSAAAIAVVWWYFAPDSLPAPVKSLIPASPNAAPPLYKWRDAKGGLHVTGVPPTDRPYETVRYDPNVNVVPSAMPPGTQPHDR
jgi:Domain of unknown function (DUF4124)